MAAKTKVRRTKDGEAYIELPPELLNELYWDEDTELVWIEQENKIILRKRDDSSNEA